MKKPYKILLILVFAVLLAPSPSAAWWLWVNGFPVQEGTQLGRLAASIKEIAEQLEMIKQHIAMLKSLKSRLLNELGIGQIMEVFAEAQSVLQQAKSLASGIKDFDAAFQIQFPDFGGMKEIIKASEEGQRMDDQWRESSKAYLKALNMTAKDFEDEQAVRDKMMEALTEADAESGQTKAIQVIGAMVNHAAFLTARSNVELGGFMESYLTRKQTEREKRAIVKKNMIRMTQNAADIKMSDESFSFGFDR